MTWTQRWGGDPGIYESFAEGCGISLRGDPVAEALAELRLVAATLMRVRAAHARIQPAAAEAELRLRYWRGERRRAAVACRSRSVRLVDGAVVAGPTAELDGLDRRAATQAEVAVVHVGRVAASGETGRAHRTPHGRA